jgi:predicted ArsR family transcriptional regulator
MFGSKTGKQGRLQRILEELEQRPEQTQVDLSRRLRVPSSTIADDLRVLEEQCHCADHAQLLQQDGQGRLSLCRCWWLSEDGATEVKNS